MSLTVTLLYVPTETLYAWPFNLASPGSKGVCYETHFHDKEAGTTRVPPEGTMSTSLRVLADVIRSWMRIRRERSAIAKRKGSDGSRSPGTSSLDDIVDNDEVLDDIVDHLGLHPLTPLERSIHLLRQKVPEPTDQGPESLERPQLEASSSQESETDRESSSQRSISPSSSRASTADTSLEDVHQARKAPSPKLPQLQTALAKDRTSTDSDEETPVPKIHLTEATPQESSYAERDQVLQNATAIPGRHGRVSPRAMETVEEDASEDSDNLGSTNDSGEVNFVKIEPCDRSQDEDQVSPKSESHVQLLPRKADSKAGTRSAGTSPKKVVFRDPFEGAVHQESTHSKPSLQVDTIEKDSPESLFASTRKTSRMKFAKRGSFDGLRAVFRSRAKSQ